MSATHLERMQCMEVWGGNSAAYRHFTTPGLEVWLRSQPYKQAESGGDVYLVSSCASGRITRLLLADVSGHGARAAGVGRFLRELMRRNVNVISQTGFVREMNQQFASEPEGQGFATALVCTFFAPTRSLQFSNAGHPAPLIYRAARSAWTHATEGAEVKRADGLADIPFGVYEAVEYSLYQTRLNPGDMVLCVSDAFIESRDAEGVMLGEQGLLELVSQLQNRSAATFLSELINQLQSLQQGNLQQDDATAILFRADGTSASFKDSIAAPLRLFRPVRDRTRLEFHETGINVPAAPTRPGPGES